MKEIFLTVTFFCLISDIRQSIDRNDCGKNPSFWKLEILVYFPVYFKNWNRLMYK